MGKELLVLGIETSCDETGIALYHTERGLLHHALYSQIALHTQYGGVVPELTSRDQVRKTLPMIQRVLAEAGCALADLDGVAYTKGPGLAGALLVGATFGRTLGWALGIPTIGVHHMEAHLLSPMLEAPAPAYPFVAFVVSGGHTLLAKVQAFGEYELLGESIDDAAGEAFDKTARIMGMPYPGGPRLAKLAEQGDPTRFRLPRPMTDRPGLDFSFSGLKTAAATLVAEHCSNDMEQDAQVRADIAASFQEAVVDTLLIKCRRALSETGLNRMVIGGGVSANQRFREQMHAEPAEVFFPRHEFCTDNGAMVAYVGAQRLLRGERDGLEIDIKPRWPIDGI